MPTETRFVIYATIPLFGCKIFVEEAYNSCSAGIVDNHIFTPEIVKRDKPIDPYIASRRTWDGYTATVRIVLRDYVKEHLANEAVTDMRYKYNPENYSFTNPVLEELDKN